MKRSFRRRMDIDDKDLEIMKLLSNNPRATLTQMKNELGIPISTVFDRLRNIMRFFSLNGYWVLTQEGKSLMKAMETDVDIMKQAQAKTDEFRIGMRVTKVKKVRKNGKKN